MLSRVTWGDIHISDFPIEVFPEDTVDKINSLVVLYKLIGWNIEVKSLSDYTENKYCIKFSYEDMKILFILTLHKDNKTFIECHLSFFSPIGSVKYEKIYDKYGVYISVTDINETSHILNIIKEILDDLELFVK